MKTMIIFILVLALAAAAFFTRPSEDGFKQYILDQTTSGDSNLIKQIVDEGRAQQFLDECTFHDRLLWVDVQQNGNTIYTGAFSHWFNRGQIANTANKVERTVSNLERKVDSLTTQQNR